MWLRMPALCLWLLLLSTAEFTLADVSHLSRRLGAKRAQQVQGNDGHSEAKGDGAMWDIRLAVPGEPGQDYPVLAAIPKTDFSCSGKSAGYYADTDAACQVFRICTSGGTFGYQSFLCPNGTLFNQEYLVCDWWMHVKCSTSQNYYDKNDKFGSLKLGPQMIKDVEKMIMYPMKNPLDKNSLGVDKMVMQLYKPPSSQIALPFDNNNNYNSGSNTYNSNTNNPATQYLNEGSLPPIQYKESAVSASTPSSLYVLQSEQPSDPQQEPAQTFSITPSKELEITFKKQQYTYPSQYDKHVTYKLSQLVDNNQNTLYNLANLQQRQAEVQRNLVSERNQKSKISTNSNKPSHLTTVLSGTLVTKSLIINKDLNTDSQTSPRSPVSRVLFRTWAPRTTKSIPILSRQYIAPTTPPKYLAPITAPKYLAPLSLPSEEQNHSYRPFKKSAPLTDGRNSTESKYNDNDSHDNLTFTEILTKETLDDTVNKIVQETSRILENTPLEKAGKIIKEVVAKTSAITSYLPANEFDEANDVENIGQSELEPIKLSEPVKSGRLTNAPSNALEPPTRITGNVFRNPSQITTLPYYKQKVNGQEPVINYSLPNSDDKSISVKLSLPEKIVSHVLNARNYTNLDHLEVFNTGNTNYLLLTNGNTSKDKKFIPLGKLVFGNPFNVSNSQEHALNFLNNAQSSKHQQTNHANFGLAAINNLQHHANLINEQNKQILSQLSQSNSQQLPNELENIHTFEQLRLQDDYTSSNGALYNPANVQDRGVQNIQLFNKQSGQLESGQSDQLVNGQPFTQFRSSQGSNLNNGQTGSQVSGNLVNGQTSQLFGRQSNRIPNQPSGQLVINQNTQSVSGRNNRLVSGILHNSNQESNTKTFPQGQGVSGQLRQYDENEAVFNPRQDFQITNQESYTTAPPPNVHSQNANFVTHTQNNLLPTLNQNSPFIDKYLDFVPNDEQNGNFYSSQFSSGNPVETFSQNRNTNSNQSGKLRVNDQVSNLYQNPESQSNRYQTSQNVLSVDNNNKMYLSGAFGINGHNTYNKALQTTKATQAENSDVETFSTLDGLGQSGKLLQEPTVLPTQNTVSQVNGYQVTNSAGANVNIANSFDQYRSDQNNNAYNSVNAENSIAGQNPINTSGRYTAQSVQPSAAAPKAEEITTTVQFIPSLSFELNDENGEDNFFAALKNGIIGDESPINRVDSENLVTGYVSQSLVGNVRSAPISSVGYEVRHTAPIQKTQDYRAPASSYYGPSSYLAPQSSVGKLDSAGPVLAAELAQAKLFSRAYIPPRLEDLGESVGYPKERPSIPFTF